MAGARTTIREWDSLVGALVFVGAAFVSGSFSYGIFGLVFAVGLVIAGGWHLRYGSEWRVFAGWLVLSGVTQLVAWLFLVGQGAPL